MMTPLQKIMSLDDAVAWADAIQGSGMRLALTNGVFDLLHRGHAEYLLQARMQADALMVAVNSDASTRALKGEGRPVVRLEDRMYLLASLECVDCVVWFEGTRALDVFGAISPDVYVKGGDYTEDTLDREEYALLKRGNPLFVFVPFVDGRSTTDLIGRIRN